jgi:hypothetical protein
LLIEKDPGLGPKLDRLKRFYWTLSTLAVDLQPKTGRQGLARWLLSGAPSAQAVRAGVRDYLLRRFGKAPDGFRERLASAEKSYAELLKAGAR